MAEQTIPTKYQVIQADGSVEEHTIEWPEDPGYDAISKIVNPYLNGEPLEHVTVLYNDARCDMFISELGHVHLTTRGPLPVNTTATEIYRGNWMKRNPSDDPDSLPTIAGIAILFERRIWY